MKKLLAFLISCLLIISPFCVSAADISTDYEVYPAYISLNSISGNIAKYGSKLCCSTSCSIFTGDTLSVRMSLQRDIPNVGWRTVQYWISPDYKNGAYSFERDSTDNYIANSRYRVVAGGTVTNNNGVVVETVVSYSPILNT